MATISLVIPDELANDIEAVCEESSCAQSVVIRQAIAQYIDDYQDYREAHKRLTDTDKSYVSLDEMRARLGIEG